MDKNDYLLASEVIYQLHTCRTLADLEEKLYYQLNLLVPFAYASYLATVEDPLTEQPVHKVSFCKPPSFAAVARAWLTNIDSAYTKWLSFAPETNVVRDSDLLEGNRRFSAPAYRDLLQSYDICDTLQMNLVYNGHRLGRLALYRTREQGTFSDRDVFHLQVLSKHLNLTFAQCSGDLELDKKFSDKLLTLTSRFHLTKREEDVLDCIFQGLDNNAICDKLHISKNTLYKHNTSIFQKCGVSSRWELLKLR